MTRKIGRWMMSAASALSVLVLGALAHAQSSPQIAGPSGNLIVKVTNDSESAVPLQNASVVFKSGPSFFHVPASVGPVASIAVGAESDFTFPYSIDSGAPAGTYTAVFTVIPAGTPNSESPDGSFDTSVGFTILRPDSSTRTA